jgi:hypothetical protein
MVEKLHRYCTAEYTARNRSGDPVDLVDCCEEAGVLLLWTSLLNCTRSVRSQTGRKQEKDLLLLRVLLSFFSNQAYKYLRGPGDSMELTCGHVIHALECRPDGREAEQVRANVECPICPKLLKDLAHEITRPAKRT